MAIDMWSLGCIMAELYTGFPIFPGENEQEQLSCIMEILGVPDKEFINRSSRKRLFFGGIVLLPEPEPQCLCSCTDSTGAPRPVVNSKGRRRRPGTKNLAQVLRTDDHAFVDFIAKCLVWDPERRMKPQVALRHEFIASGRRPRITSPGPSISKPLSLPSSSKQKGGETPKKSQISAPTPLTARSSRNTVPTTPSTLSSLTLSTSRSHRTSQQQSYSGFYSSRTINSLTVRGGRFCCFKRSSDHRVRPRQLDDHHFNHRPIAFHVHIRTTIMLSNDKYPTFDPWVVPRSHYSSTSPARSKDGSFRNTSLPK